ncbi:hypothetical protein ASE85_01715 [Sphingobium sp. Leaf26]|uniref:MAE_28990/MAE_18760 family HEPN-like nuclease n=1 Tax=Sphingobium sp. Leaf26 TaxID=1735693 RepID=UPI0006FBBCF9|nr:MAE_28990/MAE_18760 family HEPN-like nuclease [Sphingobium sp. Leaf26]KQN09693.1 hypothetical protein ASE85_01715 [Sphingobium sp. Leaf26]
MAAVRTLLQLQDAMDQELAWRIKEVGTFRVESAKGGQKSKAFTRAGVALLYAHWEGFVKRSAELYLEYVSNRGLKYEELMSCFIVFGLKGKLNTLVASRKSTPNIEAIEFIRGSLGDLAALKMAGAVNTESNLSSSVFENIAKSVGVSTTPYETKFNLIDSSLVGRRNKIAHGEFLDLKSGDFGPLVEEVLDLIRLFKNDLLNAAATEAYKKIA